MGPLEGKESKERSISVKIGSSESYTLFKIQKVENPENHFLLTIGRVVESEPFGHGYDFFLRSDQIEDLRSLLGHAKDM